MNNLAEIHRGGEFASSIREYLVEFKPKILIETGLYHGNGSTTIIANYVKYLAPDGAKFFSIECNVDFIEIAKENLSSNDLLKCVSIVSGLSIPSNILPDLNGINKAIADAFKSNVKIDHDPYSGKAELYYHKETESFESDDCIGKILEENEDPDFVMLDSAGFMGKVEFDYLISKLKKSCAIALDDTRHIKHYRSLAVIKSDSRFIILHESSEKFGSVLCKFTP